MAEITFFIVVIFILTTCQITFVQLQCSQTCEDFSKNRNTAVDIPNPCSEQFELVTDLAGHCETSFFYAENQNCVHSCFPKCIKDCGSGSACNPILCPPGFFCPNSDPTGMLPCEPDPKSCLTYELFHPNSWAGAWKPECLSDGSWKPKQCKGESHNGRCFCYDSTGNRIFGQEFKENAVNMTCACSRKRTELMSSGTRSYTSLHCDSMGNYEPLQCDNGQCWCAEPMTGEITASVVPEKMMTHLPCYSKKDIGEQYLRQCESEEIAQKKILEELKVHGTQHASFTHILCDADGTYGPYQIMNGIAYCKWKDNTGIESFLTELTMGTENLNCYCARDKKIYELAGKTQTLQCSGQGTYRPQQSDANGKWYCVDNDGFRKSDYENVFPTCDK